MFSNDAVCANAVFYRSYSRRSLLGRETWEMTCDRTLRAIADMGKLNVKEATLVSELQEDLITLPSGRFLWVGGTSWLDKPENFPGVFNCSSTKIDSWEAFGLMMDLAMQGCGTGAVLEPKYIDKLPVICNQIKIEGVSSIGTSYPSDQEKTNESWVDMGNLMLTVGDSRQGWVKAYQRLLEVASSPLFSRNIYIYVDVSHVRGSGVPLKGFGGVANPEKLPEMFYKIANILNGAVGRKLSAVECCLLIDEAALVVVAGNLRRSAGIRSFDKDDKEAAIAKLNLWKQNNAGDWIIDPSKDALRMSNHTRVFHQKPTREECIESVKTQYECGEGAIQWAGEAVARANADLLSSNELKKTFLIFYDQSISSARRLLSGLLQQAQPILKLPIELDNRMSRYGLNPCGEIILSDNFCNLSEIHLNQIDPCNFETQQKAFRAGAIIVCSLLHRNFTQERYQKSRELDPIVGVSFTGLFDFFVNAFGVDWLRWWESGRDRDWEEAEIPKDIYQIFPQLKQCNYLSTADFYLEAERLFLSLWKEVVKNTVEEYCDRHQLRRPNRYTTVQPSGTKSLLTNASPGWHPPKSQRFIRRITFRRDDPVALASIDYGYNVVPGQSDKDENGKLLDNPFDPRCTEWLVEIPTAVSWANLPGADAINISKFSALAQFDFYMQVQRYYTTHNTSSTIELREHEIEELGDRIYKAIQNDEGYISSALLARYDDHQTFPRLPFEPITKEKYEQLVAEVKQRRKTDNFHEAMLKYDKESWQQEGAEPCDSDKCLFPEK